MNWQRQKFQPYLSVDDVPAAKAVKSVYNITRERAWRPLYEKELQNIQTFHKAGLKQVYIQSDPIHE